MFLGLNERACDVTVRVDETRHERPPGDVDDRRVATLERTGRHRVNGAALHKDVGGGLPFRKPVQD